MEPPVTRTQMLEMIEMLKRTVEAGDQSFQRIETLEKAVREMFDVIVSLQENQQRLLDAFESQSSAQNKLNMDLAEGLQRLAAELANLRGGGLVM
ncbi:MAG: hypothetical protein ABJC09_16470 [Terriglobia bacterium]